MVLILSQFTLLIVTKGNRAAIISIGIGQTSNPRVLERGKIENTYIYKIYVLKKNLVIYYITK